VPSNFDRVVRGATLALFAQLIGCSSSNSNQPNNSTDSGPAADAQGVGEAGGEAGGDAGPLQAGSVDITTKSGSVHGKTDGMVRSFLDIPYAAPPTGTNRWRAPQPVAAWTSPRDATMPSKVCPQIAPGGTSPDSRSDEDCLYLNVWTPDAAQPSPLPVMVWFFGGAFVFGSGAETFYDGSNLVVTGNVVVVTLNYRLGALGFLAHPALTAESTDHPTSGNYGFEDQQAALKWVQDNIDAFGGDPAQVTIFGESAGGYSVCAHLVAPASQGLFARAISESGPCSSLSSETRDQAYLNGQALATALGCTDAATVLTCMRGKMPTDLLMAFSANKALPGGLFFQGNGMPADGGAFQGSQTWNPVVDGTVLPVSIATADTGSAHVPLLLGSNANEGNIFTAPGVFGGVPVSTDADYQAALSRRFTSAQVTQILAQYPSSAFPSPNDALNAVVTDAIFACPARRVARAASGAGATVYLYAFNHVPETALVPNLGSFHSAEFPYVFGVDDPLAVTKDDEKPLIPIMQGYWTRFAHGDPNGAGAVNWPKYTQSADQDLAIDLPMPSVETGRKMAKCDFWDGISP
jgi:para-nitrobenzyl esterase